MYRPQRRGTLLQHLKDLRCIPTCSAGLHLLLHQLRLMMWNWLVSGLALGSRVVLYDGSPFYPDPGSLFDLIDRQRISIFGIGAKYISAVEKSGLEPGSSHSLASLRTILSTGSPLSPGSFDFVYSKVKPDVHSGVDLGRYGHRFLLRARKSYRARLRRRATGAGTRNACRCLRR